MEWKGRESRGKACVTTSVWGGRIGFGSLEVGVEVEGCTSYVCMYV